MPGFDATKISSNWKQLQAQLKTNGSSDGNTLKRRRLDRDESPSNTTKRIRSERPRRPQENGHKKMGSYLSSDTATTTTTNTNKTPTESHAELQKHYDISTNDLSAAYGGFFELSTKDVINDGRHHSHKAGKYLALDCEMVGTGPPPHSDDVLARVSIVNFHGEQVYDSYVMPRPGTTVEDYRTHVSGIRAENMRAGTARTFAQVHGDVEELLEGKILVGHALKKDLQALQLSHPQRDIRDTSRHAAYRVESRGKPPALRNLVRTYLGVSIQEGAHSSLEDARATMMLYKREKAAFEEEARRLYGTSRRLPPPQRKVVLSPAVEEEDDDEDELLDGEEDLEHTATPTTPGKKKRKKKKRTKR